MSHDQERLEQALQELQQELDDLQNVDPQLRQRLERTLADLRSALAQTPRAESARQPPGVVQRLTEAAEHFEETHPTLAGTIGSVIDALGRMGI
jgi:chromosome segregation ATPase